MTSKKSYVLAKIDGLVLVTEKNRAHLKSLVEKIDIEEDLGKIEALMDQESNIIESTIHAIMERELQAGDEGIFEVIEHALSESSKTMRTGMKSKEGGERNDEIISADDLLHNF